MYIPPKEKNLHYYVSGDGGMGREGMQPQLQDTSVQCEVNVPD